MENIISYQPCDVNRLTDQYFNSPQLVKVHKSLVLKVEAKGRAVYCRDALSLASDHLLVERPFVTWLDPSKSGAYCEQCFRPLTLPIKCKRCKLIAYCSEECLNSSISHRIECEYAHVLAKFGPFHMATRVLMRELVWSTEETSYRSSTTNNGSEFTTEDKINEFLPKTDDQVSKSTRNSDPQLKSSEASISPSLSPSSQDLANFHSLLTQVDSNSFTVLICFCIASIFTSKLLHLLYDFDSPDSERRITVKLLKIALILKQNTMETYDEASGLSTGHALYLACALLNHACRPNCVRYFQGNHVIVRTLTALPADSELTISYGLNSGLDYRERREQLKERFGFDCLCADCCEEARREKGGGEEAGGGEIGGEVAGKENISMEIDRETSYRKKNMKDQNGREMKTKEKISREDNSRESHEETQKENCKDSHKAIAERRYTAKCNENDDCKGNRENHCNHLGNHRNQENHRL